MEHHSKLQAWSRAFGHFYSSTTFASLWGKKTQKKKQHICEWKHICGLKHICENLSWCNLPSFQSLPVFVRQTCHIWHLPATLRVRGNVSHALHLPTTPRCTNIHTCQSWERKNRTSFKKFQIYKQFQDVCKLLDFRSFSERFKRFAEFKGRSRIREEHPFCWEACCKGHSRSTPKAHGTAGWWLVEHVEMWISSEGRTVQAQSTGTHSFPQAFTKC